MAKAKDGLPAEPVTEEIHHRGSSAEFDAHVLLAEDNPTNQEVAITMLENIGCQVTLAETGLEALEELSRTSFDLVLMDCQMPEMDGYEATRAIRERESRDGAGTGRVPVIALTAHAMEGDREKCIQAGMDDYLTKPFVQDDLFSLMKSWLKKAPRKQGPVAGGPDTSARPVPGPTEEKILIPALPAVPKQGTCPDDLAPSSIDQGALDTIRSMQRPDKPNLLNKLINIYLNDSLRLLRELRQAVTLGDANSVRHAAHSFKSSSANVGAVRLVSLCKKLEGMDKGLSFETMEQVITQMEDEYATVRNELASELERISG